MEKKIYSFFLFLSLLNRTLKLFYNKTYLRLVLFIFCAGFFVFGFGEKAEAADTTLYVNTASSAGGDCTTNATIGVNRACPTLFAAEALLPADITTGGSAGIWTIICEGSAADTVPIAFSGTITDATHYIRVTTDSATTNGRHDGIWDNTKYRIDVSNAIALNIGNNYVKVDGLQLTNHSLSATLKYVIAFTAGTFTFGSNEVELSNLIVKGANDAVYAQMGIRGQATNLNLNIWNTVVYSIASVNSNSVGMYLGQTNSVVNVYNSTVVGSYFSIQKSGGTVNCKNSYAGGSTAGDYSGTLVKTTCASSDSSGSTGLQTVALNATNFTNVSSGTEDYRLPDISSALYNTGTNTSGDSAPLNFTADIKNATRPSGGLWDIGADEYEVPADLERPIVTGFIIPATATSRIISISTFTATDNVGVTGYKITESATPPGSGDPGWTGSSPTTYIITGTGTSHTLYAWAKDAYGNVLNNIITDSINISIAAVSCNQSDVQAEVDVSAMGDIINIPTGNCSWTTPVIILSTQDLSIIGAGIGNTIITDNGTNVHYATGRLFHANTGTGKNIRISGMTLKTGATPPSSTSGLIYIYGTGTATRVDHIDFPAMFYTGVSLHAEYGFTSGVVDSSIFTPITVGWIGNGIKLYGGTNGADDTAWTNYSFTPGTNKAWYIENNTFTFFLRGNDTWDAYGGARIVFRYNTVHGAGSGGHGNDSGNYAATHTTEVYNNTFDNTCGEVECNNGANLFTVVGWRGGTGVMFNNTFDSNIDHPAVAANYRSNPYYEGISTNGDLSTTVLQDSTASFGSREIINVGSYLYNQTDRSYCAVASSNSTSITCSSPLTGGTTNRWNVGDNYSHTYFLNDDLMCDGLAPNDGNVFGQQGWPCKQQIGTTYYGGYTYKPIYAWNNNWNGNIAGHIINTPTNSVRSNTYHVLENKTYFNCSSAADCKSKTDAVNIPGFGLNQGWTYAPYTCPNPLTGYSGGCNSAMAGTAGYDVDMTVPVISAFTIPTTSNSLAINILTFTTTDNTAVTGYKLTESPTAPLIGDAGWTSTAPTTYTFSSDGSKTLYAWAKDAIGNVSTSLNDSVIIDTNTPETTINSNPNILINTTSATFTFSASETSTFQCKLASEAYTNCTTPKNYTNLAQGEHTFFVKARDTANNEDATPAQYTFTVDSIAPTLTNLSPNNQTLPVETTSTNLTLTTSETTTCKYATTQNTDYGSMLEFNSTNNINHEILITNLNSGQTYNYYLKCQDNAENISPEATLTFLVAPQENNNLNLKNIKIKIDRQINKFKDKLLSAKNKLKIKNKDTNLANGTVRIYKNNKLFKTINIDSEGGWDYLIKLKNASTNKFKIKQYNQYGTFMGKNEAKISIDTEKPIFTSFNLPFSVTRALTKITWEAKDNNQIDKYKIYLAGRIYETKLNVFKIPQNTSTGWQKIQIRVYDKAGNSAVREGWVLVR